jgi:hypothetical protein
VFGRWPVRVAQAGTYRIEVRRWPREADAPLAGIPASRRSVDAYLRDQPVSGLLYGGVPKALSVARVQLKIGTYAQEAKVDGKDRAAVFMANIEAGPTDIEATFLNEAGKLLCGAFYVTIRKLEPTP